MSVLLLASQFSYLRPPWVNTTSVFIMRIAVLICCLGLAVADRSASKRGIGAEAFAKPHSQDSATAFNLQAIVNANQLAPQSLGDQYGYQPPYLGHDGGFAIAGLGGGYSNIPPQVAPQQKPAQLALAAAAAVAQQNFGNPAYGAPPPPRPDPQAIINNQLYSQQPQYREYEQQLQNYARQPIALNFGNSRVRAFPPPQPSPQPPISTFQAYDQGQRAQSFYAPSQDLFQAAPAQVLPEAPQPAPIVYASPQPPVAVQYAAPQSVGVQYESPSYGLQGVNGAISYSSFASGGQLTTSSGFRPIHP